MKNNIIIYVLLSIIGGLTIYNTVTCKCDNKSNIQTSQITQAPVNVIAQSTSTPTPKPTETISEEKLLVEVNNIAACNFTDKAEFPLDKDYFITRLRTWYSWDSNETQTPYTLLLDGKEISKGVLIRKDCDPYQRQWCIAADFDFNKGLKAGNYTLQLTKNKICQNSGSQNKGFIYVWGK